MAMNEGESLASTLGLAPGAGHGPEAPTTPAPIRARDTPLTHGAAEIFNASPLDQPDFITGSAMTMKSEGSTADHMWGLLDQAGNLAVDGVQ